MASSVPTSLKSSGIVPFVTRAQQVEKVKPAISYWCNYWSTKQIVTKGLHNSDEESRRYTEKLMDKLEETKTEHPNEDAIIDEVAAKAYIEQFGLEVFNRADDAIHSNKASRQTADTFQAAYTFLELLQIWPPIEPEIAAKIKFAKYHALRIAKALKKGEDPNLSNPPSDPSTLSEATVLDPKDPEVQALGGLSSPQPNQKPSVVVSDDQELSSSSKPHGLTTPQSQNSSRVQQPASSDASFIIPQGQAVSPVNAAESFYQQPEGGDVSPLAPSTHERSNSEGGGYFPRTNQAPVDGAASTVQAGPPSAPSPISPIHQQSPAPLDPPGPINNAPLSSGQTDLNIKSRADASVLPPFPITDSANYPPSYPQQPQQPAWSVPGARLSGNTAQIDSPLPVESYITDEEAVSKAQKHARWAISALNFDDVRTAVKELENALRTLGAR